jgi:hypothetical protein
LPKCKKGGISGHIYKSFTISCWLFGGLGVLTIETASTNHETQTPPLPRACFERAVEQEITNA